MGNDTRCSVCSMIEIRLTKMVARSGAMAFIYDANVTISDYILTISALALSNR